MDRAWHRLVAGSVVRRVDLDRPWTTTPRGRRRWEEGDVVVVEVAKPPHPDRGVERVDGRMADLAVGDRVVGALGTRAATLEAVGSWRDVRDDLDLHLMTSAGLLGRITSASPRVGPIVEVRYVGHVVRDGAPVRLADTVPPRPPGRFAVPTVLLVGTSMSAGKTTAARALVHLLKARGRRVVGAKLTGAGRFRDVLAMRDAGADEVLDFVDVGLASTVVPPALYRQRLDVLLGLVAAARPDVAVLEAGASPLEPYNGDAAMAAVGEHVVLTVLCASDPYAVVGVQEGFGRGADVVTGPAANTSAGVALVGRLTGLPAVDVRDPAALPVLERLLDRAGLRHVVDLGVSVPDVPAAAGPA